MQYTTPPPATPAADASFMRPLASIADVEQATDAEHASAEKNNLPPTDVRVRFTALDGAMLFSLGLLIACDATAAATHAGWVSSAVITLGESALLVGYLLRREWRPIVGQLLLFGLIAGILELGTDAAGEIVAHSLIYPPDEPMLWRSPLDMPFSWMMVLTQIGYLAWRLCAARPTGLGWPRWGAMLTLFTWGALNIPLYEEFAYYAGWWRYTPTTLHIGHTPLYVSLFEGLVVAALPLLLGALSRLRWRGVVWRAVALGLWIPWAALFAWLLVGRW